jgi:hypothetical protein
MALVTQTTLKAAARGGFVPEDVMRAIWDISKIPLPFTDAVGTDTHGNSYAEWTKDKLAAPATNNAAVDGADAPADSNALGTRVGNHSQISVKVVSASERARDGKTIALGDAYNYQVMMRQQELKRDVEAICLFNQASQADNGTLPGLSAGLDAWLTSNVNNGAGGSNPGFVTGTGLVGVAVPGTKRALSEATIRDVAQAVWEKGGNPSLLMGRPPVIRRLSSYMFTTSAQVATLTSDVREKRGAAIATGSVNVFITDFGVVLEMVANRLQPTEAAATSALFIIDPERVAISTLSAMQTIDLARTGLSQKGEMFTDWTLKVMSEEAHGVIRAVDEALAVTA